MTIIGIACIIIPVYTGCSTRPEVQASGIAMEAFFLTPRTSANVFRPGAIKFLISVHSTWIFSKCKSKV